MTRRGRGGEGTIKIQKGGLRSKKLSKSEKGVGGLGTSPTWRGGFEVQKELGRKIKEVN